MWHDSTRTGRVKVIAYWSVTARRLEAPVLVLIDRGGRIAGALCTGPYSKYITVCLMPGFRLHSEALIKKAYGICTL